MTLEWFAPGPHWGLRPTTPGPVRPVCYRVRHEISELFLKGDSCNSLALTLMPYLMRMRVGLPIDLNASNSNSNADPPLSSRQRCIWPVIHICWPLKTVVRSAFPSGNWAFCLLYYDCYYESTSQAKNFKFEPKFKIEFEFVTLTHHYV